MGIFIVEIILKWPGVLKNVYKRNSFVAVFLPVFENLSSRTSNSMKEEYLLNA